ncbi:DUF2628 domain-containing protein [Tetragenococcus muriaticus]|uniref:Zinc-ribbon domain-containing protein n=1 Tax=Tetragenococcus muriaticus 3MR10-3 TaxID=1302648 RepID=A0A091C2C4_9ENTE|nr:DUF2628 domain-containing protein [Tetragenococcus muriaticus]KFN91976.1 hypothetical protein TMU3MR103_0698 [Tetragenococcus muriaticus 3MR10-3]
MYCSNCGNKIEERTNYCPFCGILQSQENTVSVETTIAKKETRTNKSRANKGSFNFWAAFFGIFYYFYKGLWKKGLLLQSLLFILIGIVDRFTIYLYLSYKASEILSLALGATLFGRMSTIDISRKQEESETMWKELPSIFNNGVVVIGVTVASVFIYGILAVY